MLIGPDTNSYKVGFDYRLAKSQGCSVTYVKLGGNNISGNAPYFSDSYAKFIDDARANNYAHVGHYWVVGGYDIEGSANFFADHIRGRTGADFFVLDNEQLDAGRRWTDAECARFFRVLIGRGINYNLFLYGSRDNDLGRNRWDTTLALGVKVLSAIFNNRPLTNYVPATVPASSVKGHQYTSSANIGGKIAIDMNAFTDDAFTGGAAIAPSTSGKDHKMRLDWDTNGTGSLTTEDGVVGLPSMQVYNLFYRKINSDQLKHPAPDQVKNFIPGATGGQPMLFNAAEQSIMNNTLHLLAASATTQVAIDPAKLKSALQDALKAAGTEITINADTDIDPAELAAAFEAATPRITAALIKQTGAALAAAK